MAERPAWTWNEKGFVERRDFSFAWNGGFAISQKRKNIKNLHEAMQERGCTPALEISTKSETPFGNRLSAFHLKIDGIYLENIFQASKVYQNGGPYLDMLSAEPKDAKRDERHKTSGPLIAFQWKETRWNLVPRTAFYDYLYVLAAKNTIGEDDLKEILEYQWFTDIEFNPQKSINCQARSAALLKHIVAAQRWDVLEDTQTWMRFHKTAVREW